MSILNTERLNEITHHLQSVYKTYGLPQFDEFGPVLYLNIQYDKTITNDLTEADTAIVEDWPIRPVKITVHVFLPPEAYPAMLDQPRAQICDNRLEIERTFSVGDAIAVLHIYCSVDPADLDLLESMGIMKKEYS